MVDLGVGSLFAGYRIEGVAGRGGMGIVYRARHMRLERVDAIKVIAAEYAQDEAFRARFERESRVAAAIDHPNVVQVYNAGEEDGLLYLAMRYVEGTDLRTELAEATRVDAERAVAIVEQLASALDSAHEIGLVHRDVKPANVLVTWREGGEHVYLTDFGLTKRLASRAGETRSGTFVGTCDYVAPEQVMSGSVDARADIYSLGCVLYHLLAGQVPYPRDNDIAAAMAHVIESPPSLSELRPDLAERFDPVIAKAMAKEPANRYRAAIEFAADVRRAAMRHPGADWSAGRSSPSAGVARVAPTRPEPQPDTGDAAASATRTEVLPAALRMAPTTPYVGRDSEERAAGKALSDAMRGVRRIIVIGGEAGIGKTRFATRAALKAHDLGFTTSWATAAEGIGAPYGMWMTVLSHLIEHGPEQLVGSLPTRHRPHLARLLPALAEEAPSLPLALDPETERYLMFQAVVALLEALSELAPAALVLDDLQWADVPSLMLLDHVARETGHLRLLIVVTYRDDELSADHPLHDLLANLERLGCVDRFMLDVLSPEAVAELVAELTGQDIGSESRLVRAIARETKNPFFVVEILRHLAENGVISRGDDGVWNLRTFETLTLPPGVRAVAASRVRRLGQLAQPILTVAAVIGETFDVPLLERIVRRSEEEILSSLEAAVRASVLTEVVGSIGTFRFAHALFNHTLYQDLSATRRARIHRQVAEAIEAYSDDSDDQVNALAHHWIAAGADRHKAVAYARRAGERALDRLAPDHAVRWFGQALALLSPDREADPTRCDLLIGLGEARRQVGDASFRDCLIEASSLAERLNDHERMTRAVLANTLGPFGAAGPRDTERIAAIERALARLPDDAPHLPLIRAILAKEVYFGGDPHRGVELGEQALRLARAQSDRRELARVMSFTAAISRITPLERHGERVGELSRLGNELADPELRFRAANFRFIHAMHSGNREDLEEAAEVMVRLAGEIGQPVLRWTSLWACGAREWLAGDLSAAEALTMEADAMAQHHEIPDGDLITFGQLVAIRAEQDRWEELVEPLRRQIEHNPRLLLLHVTAAVIDAERGRGSKATTVVRDLARNGFPFEYDRTKAFNLARCAEVAVRVGAVDIAQQLYVALEPYRSQFATAAGISSRGSVELYLGRLASALEWYDTADAHFAAALRANARFRAPLLEARTLLASAASLLARGDSNRREEAGDRLARTMAIARSHHSTAVERESTQLIAQYGLRAREGVPG